MDDFRQQLKKGERARSKEEQQISKLTGEVDRYKRQRAILARKMAEKEGKYQAYMAEKDQRIQQLRKEARRGKQDIQMLKVRVARVCVPRS